MLGANLGKLESLMGHAGREEALATYIGGASLTIGLENLSMMTATVEGKNTLWTMRLELMTR
jgi:hypothetical protein